MASTYVNDLRLEEIGTGEQSGTWGDTTNTNLELIAEAFAFGTEAITTNADTHATTIADGATDPGRALFLKYTGTLDSACTITLGPNTVSKMWFIQNATSGSQNIIISQGSGANVTITAGQTKSVYSDGAGSGAAIVDAFATLNVVDLLVDGELSTASAGTSNFRAGVNAGNSIASGGNYNVVLGDEAGTALTTGDGNIAIGFEALKTEDAHGHNTAIGYQALKTLDAGANSRNVAVGYQAGLDMTTGIRNVLTGTFAGANLIAGSNNVAFGEQALTTDRNGSHSTALGHAALASQDFATAADSNNTAVGHNAGLLITTGVLNTLVGSLAGDALTVGNSNVAVGTLALTTDTKGDQSVAIGNNALSAQNFTTSVDAYNVAVGAEAGNDITTGQRNVIMGGRAGHKLTDCSHNTGIGDQALTTDTLGAKSTAVGSGALATQNFTTATNSFNTAVGYYAGVATTTGTQNTILGGLSGVALTTGTNNVLIGYSAGSSSSVDLTTGSNNIVIGGNRPSLPAGELHSILIGTVANIAGKGNNTGFISPNGGAVYQGNNSTAWSQTSDRRLKKNIVNSTIGLSEINQLQVRNFEYRTVDEVTELEGHTVIDKSGVQVGVIAQEIQAILPKCVKEESTGVLSVDPDNLTWHMVKAVQELSTALDAALARITTLEG